MNRQDFITERIKLYRKNPVLFAKEVVCFTPDEWQSGVLMDVATAPKVSVRSGQGVGKTSIEAVIAIGAEIFSPVKKYGMHAGISVFV